MWVHMVQHALLGMAVPLLLVLSAPLTLALQSAGPATRRTVAHRAAQPARPRRRPPARGAGALFGGGLVAHLPDAAARPVRPQRRRAPGDPRPRGGRRARCSSPSLRRGRPAARPPAARAPACWPCWSRCRSTRWSAWRCCRPGTPIAPEAYPLLSDQRTAAGLFWGTGELFTLVGRGASSCASGGSGRAAGRGPRGRRPRRRERAGAAQPRRRLGSDRRSGVLTRFMAAATPSDTISSTASAASCTTMSSSVRSRLPTGLQHVVGTLLLGRRLAHADAHPQELVGVQVGLDRAQPVVAGQPAALLDLELPGGQVELVLHDHELARGRSMPCRRTSWATDSPDRFM